MDEEFPFALSPWARDLFLDRGRTLLMAAAFDGRHEAFEVLRPSADAVDHDGRDALYWAALGGSIATLRAALSLGFSPASRASALTACAAGDFLEGVEELLASPGAPWGGAIDGFEAACVSRACASAMALLRVLTDEGSLELACALAADAGMEEVRERARSKLLACAESRLLELEIPPRDKQRERGRL